MGSSEQFLNSVQSGLGLCVVLVKSKSIVEVLDGLSLAFSSLRRVGRIGSHLLFSDEAELEVSLGVLVVQLMSSPEVELSLSDVSLIILSTSKVEVAFSRVRVEL